MNYKTIKFCKFISIFTEELFDSRFSSGISKDLNIDDAISIY